MTYIFLILALLSAWATYNLYHPVYQHPKGVVISFISGWLVGELLWHHLAFQVAMTLLFIGAGVVEGVIGALAMLVLLVSWWAMLQYHQLSDQAKDDIEQSLVRGLGSNYREALQSEAVLSAPRSLSKPQLAQPLRVLRSPDVECLKNICYEQIDGLNLKLDIRRHRNPARRIGNAPVLFQIHGGAWTHKMGSKNEQALPLMNCLAEMGWVCVSISYRLSPRATFPDHIIDCKKALVWVKKHIAEYGGNPDFIVVTGGSAGGHLSSLLSLTENYAPFQPGFEEEDTRVKGCVPFYGIYDFYDEQGLQYHKALEEILEKSVLKVSKQRNPELYKQASPINHIHADAPPFMVIQGDRDTLVSTDETRYFVERLRQISSNPVVYAEIAGAQHAFDVFPSVRSEHVLKGVVEFVSWLYSGYVAERLSAEVSS